MRPRHHPRDSSKFPPPSFTQHLDGGGGRTFFRSPPSFLSHSKEHPTQKRRSVSPYIGGVAPGHPPIQPTPSATSVGRPLATHPSRRQTSTWPSAARPRYSIRCGKYPSEALVARAVAKVRGEAATITLEKLETTKTFPAPFLWKGNHYSRRSSQDIRLPWGLQV